MNLPKTFSRKSVEAELSRAPFDVSSLEAEIAATLNQPPTPPLPLVITANVAAGVRVASPPPSAEDLGRITAEAVKQSHEEAAQAITELGIQAAARVERINALKLEADALAKACLDLAEQFRARGSAQSDAIEATAKLNNEARAMVDEMRKKIEQPVRAEEQK